MTVNSSVSSSLNRDARRALDIANAVRADLNTHEAVCAQRYLDTQAAIKSLADWLRRAIIGTFSLMLAMIAFLVAALLRKSGII